MQMYANQAAQVLLGRWREKIQPPGAWGLEQKWGALGLTEQVLPAPRAPLGREMEASGSLESLILLCQGERQPMVTHGLLGVDTRRHTLTHLNTYIDKHIYPRTRTLSVSLMHTRTYTHSLQVTGLMAGEALETFPV